MNDSLYDRMRRGEGDLAATMIGTLQPGAVVTRVKRRRVARAATSATAALAIVGTGAAGALAWWPTGVEEDATGGVAAPAASATLSATPTPAAPLYAYGENPTGLPVLEPASQAVADAVIDPRPGPDFAVGQPAAYSDVISPAAIASCVDSVCGMPDLAPVTQQVLDSGKLSAAIYVTGMLNGGEYPYQELQYIAVAGPEVGAYMAIDLSKWALDAGLRHDETFIEVLDLAADPDSHVVAAAIGTYVSGDDYEATQQATVVLWDLDTGTSTIVADGLDRASISWDGKNWRVYGYGPEGSLGALVAADAESWTADGVQVAQGWTIAQGPGYDTFYGRNAWTNALYFGGEVYPSQPDGMEYCDPPAVATDGALRTWCVPGNLPDEDRFNDSLQVPYQLTAGVGWEVVDAALVGTMPPPATSSGKLGDGYVLWRGGSPTYVADGEEVGIGAPNMEPGAEGLADGGLWMVGFNELGWMGPDLTYVEIMSFTGDLTLTATFPYGERAAS